MAEPGSITEPGAAWSRQPAARWRRQQELQPEQRLQPEESSQRQEPQQQEPVQRQERRRRPEPLPSWRKQRATATTPERRGSSLCSCERSPQCGCRLIERQRSKWLAPPFPCGGGSLRCFSLVLNSHAHPNTHVAASRHFINTYEHQRRAQPCVDVIDLYRARRVQLDRTSAR